MLFHPLRNLLDQINRYIKTLGFAANFFSQYVGDMFFPLGTTAIRITAGNSYFRQRTFDKGLAVGQPLNRRVTPCLKDID
jgi:uncharacterized membrane protein